jgi:hypothetical protein
MEPAVPIFETVRLSVLSQEPDTNDPVNLTEPGRPDVPKNADRIDRA